jgi:hypothetical protein
MVSTVICGLWYPGRGQLGCLPVFSTRALPAGSQITVADIHVTTGARGMQILMMSDPPTGKSGLAYTGVQRLSDCRESLRGTTILQLSN